MKFSKLFDVFTVGALFIYALLLIIVAIGAIFMYPGRAFTALLIIAGVAAAQIEGNPVHAAWSNARNAVTKALGPKVA